MLQFVVSAARTDAQIEIVATDAQHWEGLLTTAPLGHDQLRYLFETDAPTLARLLPSASAGLESGQGVPRVVRAGEDIVSAEQPGAFPVQQVVQVTRDQTITVQLPPLRPRPEMRQLPLPQAQSTWSQVSFDTGGGWRLQATRVEPEANGPRPGWGPAPVTPPGFVLHLDAQGLSLDLYAPQLLDAQYTPPEGYAVQRFIVEIDRGTGGRWQPWNPRRVLPDGREVWVWRDLSGRPRSLRPWDLEEATLRFEPPCSFDLECVRF